MQIRYLKLTNTYSIPAGFIHFKCLLKRRINNKEQEILLQMKPLWVLPIENQLFIHHRSPLFDSPCLSFRQNLFQLFISLHKVRWTMQKYWGTRSIINVIAFKDLPSIEKSWKAYSGFKVAPNLRRRFGGGRFILFMAQAKAKVT